jgi:hypothetical protein
LKVLHQCVRELSQSVSNLSEKYCDCQGTRYQTREQPYTNVRNLTDATVWNGVRGNIGRIVVRKVIAIGTHSRNMGQAAPEGWHFEDAQNRSE